MKKQVAILDQGEAADATRTREFLRHGDREANDVVQVRMEELVIPTCLPASRTRIRCFWKSVSTRQQRQGLLTAVQGPDCGKACGWGVEGRVDRK